LFLLKSLEKFEQNLLRDFASSALQAGIISQAKRVLKAMLTWIEFDKFIVSAFHRELNFRRISKPVNSSDGSILLFKIDKISIPVFQMSNRSAAVQTRGKHFEFRGATFTT